MFLFPSICILYSFLSTVIIVIIVTDVTLFNFESVIKVLDIVDFVIAEMF